MAHLTHRGLKLFDEENLPEPVSVEQVATYNQSLPPIGTLIDVETSMILPKPAAL